MHDSPEVIKHWPPQYLVGKQVNDDKKVLATYEDDFCKIELFEIECEWNYSNPTGMFNLSIPEKQMRTKQYTNISYRDFKVYQLQA